MFSSNCWQEFGHARPVTDHSGERKANDRSRDLLDIVLLSTLAPPSSELRVVCTEDVDRCGGTDITGPRAGEAVHGRAPA
jgi:hypothetical protein